MVLLELRGIDGVPVVWFRESNYEMVDVYARKDYDECEK